MQGKLDRITCIYQQSPAVCRYHCIVVPVRQRFGMSHAQHGQYGHNLTSAFNSPHQSGYFYYLDEVFLSKNYLPSMILFQFVQRLPVFVNIVVARAYAALFNSGCSFSGFNQTFSGNSQFLISHHAIDSGDALLLLYICVYDAQVWLSLHQYDAALVL